MIVILEIFTKAIVYLMLFFGVWLLAWPLLLDARRFRVRQQRMRKTLKKDESQVNSRLNNPVIKHINLIVEALSKKNAEKDISIFYAVTLGLFFSTITVLIVMLDMVFFSFIIAAAVASIPYLILRFRLANLRIEASLAFMKEFHIFYQSYQQHKDVYHTFMAVSPLIRDKRLRVTFIRLLSTMQKERSMESFETAAQLMAFSIGSSFASRFSSLLVKAYREHIDISEGLLDIHKDLQKREKDMAAIKTKRVETILLGFMPLVFLPLFLFMAHRLTMMYTFSFATQDKSSFWLLGLSFILAIISALSAYLLAKPKADY